MIPGTIGLDAKVYVSYITRDTYYAISETCARTINVTNFKREAQNNVEMLNVDKQEDKYIFKGYTKDGKINVTVDKQKQCAGTYGSYNPPSSLILGWHSNWQNVASDSEDWNAYLEPTKYQDIADGSYGNNKHYCTNLSSSMFWSVGTSINCHWNRFSDGDYKHHYGQLASYTVDVQLNQNTVLADYIMDSNTDTSSAVWTLLKPTGYDIVTELQGKYNSNALASWDLPSSYGTGLDIDIAYYCDGKKDKAKYAGGNFAKEVTYTNKYVAKDWYELTLRQRNINIENIVNDINSNILAQYEDIGYTGKITEGLPITKLKKAGRLDFTIDTSSLEKSVYIGFKTDKITEENEAFENLFRSSAIASLKIDGENIVGGSKLVTAGVHNISIDVDTENVPLFFKIAYPTSDDSTIRKAVVLPISFNFAPKM